MREMISDKRDFFLTQKSEGAKHDEQFSKALHCRSAKKGISAWNQSDAAGYGRSTRKTAAWRQSDRLLLDINLAFIKTGQKNIVLL